MINKTDFLKMVQDKMNEAGSEKVSQKTLSEVIAGCSDAIRQVIADNESVRFGNVGTFSGVHRDARTARNPRTGDTVDVPARDGVGKFKFSKTVKDDSKED